MPYRISLILKSDGGSRTTLGEGFEPLNTLTNDTERMRIWAENVYRTPRQEPIVASTPRQLEETLREVAEAERQMVVTVANRIATKPIKYSRQASRTSVTCFVAMAAVRAERKLCQSR